MALTEQDKARINNLVVSSLSLRISDPQEIFESAVRCLVPFRTRNLRPRANAIRAYAKKCYAKLQKGN